MRRISLIVLLIFFIIFPSCSSDNDEDVVVAPVYEKQMELGEYDIDTLPAPESLDERFSYAYGNLLAESLERAEQNVDALYFARGFLDYYGSPFFSDSELDSIFLEYQNRMLEEAAEEYERESEANLEEAEQFLEINGRRNGVITTPSGLEYEIVRSVEGNAPHPGKDDIVLIDYTMTLLNGQIVESSYDRGTESQIKVSDLIEGAAEGIQLMKEGERFRFWIHPEKGYGENGVSVIGPNELLIFEVELVDIL